MKADVFNMQGEKVSETELPAAIFEAAVNVDLMHQAYQRQMANARLGTHKTKTRSEVSGGGQKPWKQKGTGRARQGSRRAVQWVGGGRVHTPRPRSYFQRMPKKMRQAALRSALSVKAAESGVVLVDDMNLAEARTKFMTDALSKLVGDASVLVIFPEKDMTYEAVMRSANNLPDTKVMLAGYLNIRDLLGYDKLVLPVKTLEALTAQLG